MYICTNMHVIVEPSEIFKALGDPLRLRIMALLIRSGEEICVCEFVDSLEVPQYGVSKALKILMERGLLERGKEGRWIYYRLSEMTGANFLSLICQAIGTLDEETFDQDQKAFERRLVHRTDGRCCVGIMKEHLV